MALIIQNPTNPLAEALGVLSQQILSDAASRKEREFRTQEIAKERTFMAGENAATRALQQSQNEAQMKYLTQVAADTRLSEQERTQAMKDMGILQAEVQREVGLADAGARGSQGAAGLELVRQQGEQRNKMFELISPLLQSITAGVTAPVGTGGGPRKNYVELTPEQTEFYNAMDWKVDGAPVGRYLTPEQARTIAGGQSFGQALMGGELFDFFKQGPYNRQLLQQTEDTETGMLARQDSTTARQQNLGNLVQTLQILSQVTQ